MQILMIKLTLLHQCVCTIITRSCVGGFQYPMSSGGQISVALHCVYLCVAKKYLPSHSKKRDLKVTCISSFWILLFNWHYSAQRFASQCKMLPFTSPSFPRRIWFGVVWGGWWVSYGQCWSDKYCHLVKMSIIKRLSSSAAGPPSMINISY